MTEHCLNRPNGCKKSHCDCACTICLTTRVRATQPAPAPGMPPADEPVLWAEAARARPPAVARDLYGPSVVGKFYRSMEKFYYCESRDVRIGFWMSEVDPKTLLPLMGGRVTCVSERAIGRTYHRVSIDRIPTELRDLRRET